MMNAKKGALLFMLLANAAPAGAQRALIPNSVMPGRERELFTDLPTPKSTIGGVDSPYWNGRSVGPKQSHSSGRKAKRRQTR